MTHNAIPTIRTLDCAPELAVLSALDCCAGCAERALVSRHDLATSMRDLMQDEPPDPPDAQCLACNQLLGRITELKHAIILYQAALGLADSNPHVAARDIPF